MNLIYVLIKSKLNLKNIKEAISETKLNIDIPIFRESHLIFLSCWKHFKQKIKFNFLGICRIKIHITTQF